MARNQKRRGRPPKLDDSMQQITLRVPEEVLAVADQIKAQRLDRPDRSTILREAMAIGLATMMKRDR